jgi:hypothetical protein
MPGENPAVLRMIWVGPNLGTISELVWHIDVQRLGGINGCRADASHEASDQGVRHMMA